MLTPNVTWGGRNSGERSGVIGDMSGGWRGASYGGNGKLSRGCAGYWFVC